jgi:hypothetical protein
VPSSAGKGELAATFTPGLWGQEPVLGHAILQCLGFFCFHGTKAEKTACEPVLRTRAAVAASLTGL